MVHPIVRSFFLIVKSFRPFLWAYLFCHPPNRHLLLSSPFGCLPIAVVWPILSSVGCSAACPIRASAASIVVHLHLALSHHSSFWFIPALLFCRSGHRRSPSGCRNSVVLSSRSFFFYLTLVVSLHPTCAVIYFLAIFSVVMCFSGPSNCVFLVFFVWCARSCLSGIVYYSCR